MKAKKEVNFKSKLINNEFLSQYFKPFKVQLFNSEEEVEEFEQKMCKGDNKTWMSWISQKEKFSSFPCYIVYRYVYHKSNDEYTAVYLTLDEAINDLQSVISQLNNLKDVESKLKEGGTFE